METALAIRRPRTPPLAAGPRRGVANQRFRGEPAAAVAVHGHAEPALTWPRLLAALLARENLNADDARWAMREVMDDACAPAELAAFLVALRAKGKTADEFGGMLDAVMEGAVPLPVDGSGVTDIAGTGGDGAQTVNISTMAAIVTAAAGAPVVKHGGKAVSSRSGSADVIEALGIPLDWPGPRRGPGQRAALARWRG